MRVSGGRTGDFHSLEKKTEATQGQEAEKGRVVRGPRHRREDRQTCGLRMRETHQEEPENAGRQTARSQPKKDIYGRAEHLPHPHTESHTLGICKMHEQDREAQPHHADTYQEAQQENPVFQQEQVNVGGRPGVIFRQLYITKKYLKNNSF